jgi:hypothetical protein
MGFDLYGLNPKIKQDTIKPEKPDRWHFFLTEGGIKNYIDPNCNFYFLKDFE